MARPTCWPWLPHHHCLQASSATRPRHLNWTAPLSRNASRLKSFPISRLTASRRRLCPRHHSRLRLAREPQGSGLSLARESSREQTVRLGKEGTHVNQSLPGRDRTRSEISARTSRLSAGVRSQGVGTGRAGEVRVTKGPGRDAPGECTEANVRRQSPQADEALREPRPFVVGCTDAGGGSRGWCVWSPGDNGPASDR